MRALPKLLPVILSGGAGARLWPLSQKHCPKPFITLADGDTLIQKAYRRAGALAQGGDVITVTNRNLFLRTKDAFATTKAHVEHNTYLLEPVGRNSAAAIAVAAHYAAATYGPECVLVILPADQLITDMAALEEAVVAAAALAARGKLVTFGIRPTGPETGFGYIEVSGDCIRRFVEKPDQQTAKEYLAAGTFLWNAGIFCMKSGIFLEELARLCPDTAQGTRTALARAEKSTGPDWHQYMLPQKDFESLADISVDYAVFEKSKNVAVVPCDIGWSDIGSWETFGSLYPSDDHQNHFSGTVLLKETTQSIVHGGEKLIATLGVHDLVIADTADALLVASKARVQDVRHLVDSLQKKEKNTEDTDSSATRCAWGQYTVLHADKTIQLKRLEVAPGASLGTQICAHKGTHWTVMNGVATVTTGDTQCVLETHQSTYIPEGVPYNLANRTPTPIVLMEMQVDEGLDTS